MLERSTCIERKVDEFLTVLLHGHTKEVVGVKLKGFRNIYLALAKIFDDHGIDIETRIPFRTFIAIAEAMACRVADHLMDEPDDMAENYNAARRFVGGAKISAREVGFQVHH